MVLPALVGSVSHFKQVLFIGCMFVVGARLLAFASSFALCVFAVMFIALVNSAVVVPWWLLLLSPLSLASLFFVLLSPLSLLCCTVGIMFHSSLYSVALWLSTSILILARSILYFYGPTNCVGLKHACCFASQGNLIPRIAMPLAFGTGVGAFVGGKYAARSVPLFFFLFSSTGILQVPGHCDTRYYIPAE